MITKASLTRQSCGLRKGGGSSQILWVSQLLLSEVRQLGTELHVLYIIFIVGKKQQTGNSSFLSLLVPMISF